MDACPGLVHTVRGTAGHVGDVTECDGFLDGEETVVFADPGIQAADKRPDARPNAQLQVAMPPGKHKKLDEAGSPVDSLIDQVEKLKAGIHAKVNHLFRVIKRQFGLARGCHRRLKRNTLQLKTLFALFMPVDGQAPSDGNAGVCCVQKRGNRPE